MKLRSRVIGRWGLIWGLVLFARVAAESGGDPEGARNLAGASDLPRGEGIARLYPADRGIAGHPAVIFADDFESEIGRAHV